MYSAKKKSINMIEGPLLGKIIAFILPLVATNLLQVFYNAADMVIVGLSDVPDALGAIGTTTSLIHLIVNIFIGISVGANVVVARNLGAKEDEEVTRGVHTATCMGVLFGAVTAVIGFFVARPALMLMGNEGELLFYATKYMRYYFIGVPFISLTNFAIAILRAKGDTKTPLYVLMGTGILNVALNLFFVLVMGKSVDGVALATVIANAASAILLYVKLARDSGPCRFIWRELRINAKSFREILNIGIPAGVQGIVFSLSNVIIQSSILQVNNSMCTADSLFQPVVKGNAAAQSLESFVYTPTNAVYQAAITFTSQNTGAGKYDRVKRVMVCCYSLGLFISVFFGGGLLLLRRPLLALYGVTAGEPGSLMRIAYESAECRMFYLFIPYFTVGFMEIGSGVVRGLGHSVLPVVMSVIGSCALRIIWVYTVFRAIPKLQIIYLSYPISWILTAIAHFVCILIIFRKLPRPKSKDGGYSDLAETCV